MPPPSQDLFPPIVYAPAFPKGEQHAARNISSTLTVIHVLLKNFGTALELFDGYEQLERIELANKNYQDDARRRRLFFAGDVMNLAARDAAMTIWHLEDAMDRLSSLLSQCPTLQRRLPRKPLKAARGIFNQAFPHSKAMRDATAHIVTSEGSLEELERGAGSGAASVPRVRGSIVAKNMLVDRTLYTTLKGMTVSCAVTHESHNNLTRVVRLIFDVFRKPARDIVQEYSTQLNATLPI